MLMPSSFGVLAQSINGDSLKLIELDKRIVVIENAEKLREKNFESQTNKYKNEIFKEFNEKEWDFYRNVVIGFVIGLLTIFIPIFIGFRKKMESMVNQTIVKKINEKDETIMKLLSEMDLETRLLKEKKIKIVGEQPDRGKKSIIEEVLKRVGFNMKNVGYDLKYFDVLVINNENSSVEEVEMLEMAKELARSNTTIFYFNNKRKHFPLDKLDDPELKMKVNFATNPAQIYGNLLNSLKYQDRLSNRIF